MISILAACAAGDRAVVVTDRAIYPGQGSANTVAYHTVQAGDTLYAIARRYGRDYREVAAANDIGPPYELRIGQRLVLSAAPAVRPDAAKSRGEFEPHAEVFALPPLPAVEAPTPEESVPSQAPAPAATSQPEPAPAAKSPQASTSVSQPKVEKIRAPLPKNAPARGKWKWPANGTTIKSSSNGDGLNITGKLGAPVFAAAPGRVVYQGSGLRGYGKLIIIKHSDEYLSAYAHNDKLLVQEGQQVRQGQQIAEMGKTGTDRVMLHFQIRRNGAPVNPLKLLPKR